MKVLNRHNLAIANLAPRDDGSRYRVCAILVSPAETVETDGHQMLVVTAAEAQPALSLSGIERTEEFEPFMMPTDVAREMAMKLPRESPIRFGRYRRKIPKGKKKSKKEFAVDAKAATNGHLIVGVGDEEQTFSVNFKRPAGTFPEYKKVAETVNGNALAKIRVDPQLLGRLLVHMSSFARHVDIEIRGPEQPLFLKAVNENTQQEMRGYLMPMRAPNADS